MCVHNYSLIIMNGAGYHIRCLAKGAIVQLGRHCWMIQDDVG